MEDFTQGSRSTQSQGALPVVDLYNNLKDQLDEHPYEILAVAAGIGFILGGGLFSRLGGKAVAAALRVGLASAVSPVLKSMLQEVTNFDTDSARRSPAQRPS
jgi:hypothetical protein